MSTIHSLFLSSVAAAYPLTGVRRARTLSLSLSPNNRPRLQLVAGYRHDRSSRNESIQFYADRSSVLIDPFVQLAMMVNDQAGELFSANYERAVVLIQKSLSFRNKQLHCALLNHEKLSKLNVCELRVVELLDVHVAFTKLIEIGADCPFIERARLNRASQSCCRAGAGVRGSVRLKHVAALSMMTLVTLAPRLTTTDPNRGGDSSNATDALYGGPIDFNPRPRPIEQEPPQAKAADQKYRGRPCTLEPSERPNAKFPIQHSQLQVIYTRLSLQAPRHYVQRGAA